MTFITHITCTSPAVGLEKSCSWESQFPLTHPQYHLYSSDWPIFLQSLPYNQHIPSKMHESIDSELAGARNPLVKKPGKHKYRLRDDQSHPSYKKQERLKSARQSRPAKPTDQTVHTTFLLFTLWLCVFPQLYGVCQVEHELKAKARPTFPTTTKSQVAKVLSQHNKGTLGSNQSPPPQWHIMAMSKPSATMEGPLAQAKSNTAVRFPCHSLAS